MSMIEKTARALCVAAGDDPDREGPWAEWWNASAYSVQARAVIEALMEPTPEMVAKVVQEVGDPSPQQWAVAERAVIGICGPNMQGEAVAAELVRDWQAMLAAALGQGAAA